MRFQAGYGHTVVLVSWYGECVQNFSEKNFWKNIIWKTGKKWNDNITIGIGEMGCEDSRWMEQNI